MSDSPTPPRRFHFGLGTLFVLVAVVAILCGAYRLDPEGSAVVICLWIFALFVLLATAGGPAETEQPSDDWVSPCHFDTNSQFSHYPMEKYLCVHTIDQSSRY